MRPLAFIIEKVTDMFMSYTKLYKCQILICVPRVVVTNGQDSQRGMLGWARGLTLLSYFCHQRYNSYYKPGIGSIVPFIDQRFL